MHQVTFPFPHIDYSLSDSIGAESVDMESQLYFFFSEGVPKWTQRMLSYIVCPVRFKARMRCSVQSSSKAIGNTQTQTNLVPPMSVLRKGPASAICERDVRTVEDLQTSSIGLGIQCQCFLNFICYQLSALHTDPQIISAKLSRS